MADMKHSPFSDWVSRHCLILGHFRFSGRRIPVHTCGRARMLKTSILDLIRSKIWISDFSIMEEEYLPH